MLYLNPPFHVIRGVTVFADHADPAQFYYLPAMPHLTLVNDVPQIQLLQFRGQTGGGFLNFTVDLGIGEQLLADVTAETKRIFNVEGRPRMAPVVLEDGSTRLTALGKESDPVPANPPAGPPPDPPPAGSELPGFVVKIDHPSKPALYGDNTAIFGLRLDEYGTTIVRDSFEGVLMPIGIVYELEFLALRPAFNVRVHADWDRVQKHFQEESESRFLFFSSDVDKIVDKLVEDQVIVIEVDNFIPEGEDAGNVISDPKKALDQVKDMIFETFFTPTLNPVSAAKDGWDKATDVGTKLSTLAVTGGWASIASATYKKVDMTRIDRKRFDFNLRERTTVRRKIYPQAHLQGLTQILRDGGLSPSDFVRSISLDDPFFRHRRVRVFSSADRTNDDIASVTASLTYGNERKSVTLDETKKEETLDWTSIVANGAVQPEVEASYTVAFANVDTLDRPASLACSPRTITDETFDVNPRADGLFHVVNVPITALNFPWTRYPQVQVDLRYTDDTNSIDIDDTILLDTTTQTKLWKWFLRDRAKDSFEYRVTYRAADNRDWSLDWQATQDEQVLLRDPRPQARTVMVVPAVSWANVSQIFVDLSYRDDVNHVRGDASLNFFESHKDPQTFTVPLEDPEQRIVNYETKILFTDNSLIEFPRSMTMQNQIIVRADMRGHRVVAVRPPNVNFTAKKVRELRAKLRYVDEPNSLDYVGEFTFSSPGVRAFFEYDFVDPQRRAFTVECTTVFMDGFVAQQRPVTMDVNDVTLTVA